MKLKSLVWIFVLAFAMLCTPSSAVQTYQRKHSSLTSFLGKMTLMEEENVWPNDRSEVVVATATDQSGQQLCDGTNCRLWTSVLNTVECHARILNRLVTDANMYYVKTARKSEYTEDFGEFLYAVIPKSAVDSGSEQSEVHMVRICIPVGRSGAAYFDSRCPNDGCKVGGGTTDKTTCEAPTSNDGSSPFDSSLTGAAVM
mmetsp:Transcript_48729/g.56009  ORF Transcript_48729/g.56009 Transcript_48729/m.56009 type:complete len:200 (+) Transcript_48729:86-685(+)